MNHTLLDGHDMTGTAGETGHLVRFPVSPSQRQLWLIQQMDSRSPAYNIPSTFRLRGPLDVAALERSLQTLIARHEILRTRFVIHEERPVQLVEPSVPFSLPFDEPPAGTPVDQASIEQWCKAVITTPFDLTRAPLISARLLRVGPEDHVLELVVHHILADQRAIAILSEELATLYRGGSNVLTEPPDFQFPDYVVWLNEWLTQENLSTRLDFWESALRGQSGLLELPGDRPRPSSQTFCGAEIDLRVPADVVTGLKTISRQLGVSLFVSMLTAWQVLLARLAGQTNVIVATPFANRGQEDLQNVLGCFINTLPMALDLSDRPTMRDAVMRVRQMAVGAQSYQDTPFEAILGRLNLKRNSSYNAVFQHAFMLQDPPMQLALHGLEVESFWLGNGCAKFDTTAWLWPDEDGSVRGTLEYNTDLFDASTVKTFARCYVQLLRSFVNDPAVTTDRIEILAPADRQRMLHDWNASNPTSLAAAGPLTVDALLAAQAARTPDAVAVTFEGRSLTYAALESRATRLARHLRSIGVGPNMLAGICMDRSLDMVVAIVGVLKAGGGYLPLDPAFPQDRLAFMVEDAGAAVLITQNARRNLLPGTDVPVLCIDSDWSTIEARSDAPLDCPGPAPADLAYVIYTSGSTGKPKGVQVPHRAVVNFLTSMAREPGLQPGDVLLAVTTLSFDISVLELLLPLSVGATSAVASRQAAADAAALQALLASTGATVMQATPSTWRMLFDGGWEGNSGLKVLCGGEAFPRDLAQRLVACTKEVWNMYGPTETTVWSTIARLEADRPITIGRPIANTRVYSLDEQQQPVPPGVFGELYIGGDGVALGYLNREELTAERFVQDPFAGVPDARMYRSGDRVRWTAEGRLECAGRLDNQVKVRGFRIELGEIESSLRQLEDIHSAVAHVYEVRPGDPRLVAYYVLVPGAFVTVTALRKHLRRELPEYMIPQHFVEIDDMPLTLNNKVDRKALPPPVAALGLVAHVEPTTELERSLARLWGDVLGVEKISAHANFFDLGGSSLSAVRVVTKMRDQLQIDVSLRTLVSDSLHQIADSSGK